MVDWVHMVAVAVGWDDGKDWSSGRQRMVFVHVDGEATENANEELVPSGGYSGSGGKDDGRLLHMAREWG